MASPTPKAADGKPDLSGLWANYCQAGDRMVLCLPEIAVPIPGLIVFLSERNASYRQVYTDGRALPEELNPAWNGYSTGRWEGDTLVVETTGFVDGQWLDRSGSPLTSSARMTERFRRPNYGTLEIELTVDDPKAYTKPWSIQLKQSILLDSDLLDYICLENEKDAAHLVGK